MSGADQALGAKGEALAKQHLEKVGYKILDQNVKCKLGEIDLVARDGNTLVFVEVKARRSTAAGYPEEAVNKPKQEKLARLAQWYMMDRKWNNVPVRFDVVSVLLGENEPKITVYQDAFGVSL